MTRPARTWIAVGGCLVLALGAPASRADVDVVVDNFDGYADNGAWQAVWGETTGIGTAPALVSDHNAGILTTDATLFPGIQGKAIDHIGAAASTPGMVNQYGGVIDQTSNVNPLFTINPSAAQTIVLRADLYTSISGNERMTVGLRGVTAVADGVDADIFPDAVTSNILEMGQFNQPAAPAVPGAPTVVTHFAYRLVGFGDVTSPVAFQPNWQYFTLAPELDRASDVDAVTDLADVGAGWHTYTATITADSITLSIDLFRDGKINLTRDGGTGPILVGVGADGVDASITYDILTQAAGFNSLRMGGPSGVTSGGTGADAFDNISLRLVAVPEPSSLILAGVGWALCRARRR